MAIKKPPAAVTAGDQKGGETVEPGFTSYGYLGEINGQLIEVASPSELYELLENDES
ncbi:MAG: hypothetical protein J6M06_02715 [Synergistaceae bacterium]|nr:hypothetical protein [Synergistaceae bacterium]